MVRAIPQATIDIILHTPRTNEGRKTYSWPRLFLYAPSIFYAALLLHGILTFRDMIDLFDGRYGRVPGIHSVG